MLSLPISPRLFVGEILYWNLERELREWRSVLRPNVAVDSRERVRLETVQVTVVNVMERACIPSEPDFGFIRKSDDHAAVFPESGILMCHSGLLLMILPLPPPFVTWLE